MLALSPSLKHSVVHFFLPAMSLFLVHEPSQYTEAYSFPWSTARHIYRTLEECEGSGAARHEEEEGTERSPSLQRPDINQTNYGATTVSNPCRENEMIRGRSQLNTEQVMKILIT